MDTIIQLTFGQITISVAFFVICISIVQWLISKWLEAKLQQSIRLEYDKQLEDYKFSISKRDKIANIASLFSFWSKYRGHERKWLNDRDLIDYYRKLTKMSFELTLWIDDDNLLKDVMKRLRNDEGAKNTIDLLLEAKRMINGNKQISLTAKDITIWPVDTKFIEEGRDDDDVS